MLSWLTGWFHCTTQRWISLWWISLLLETAQVGRVFIISVHTISSFSIISKPKIIFRLSKLSLSSYRSSWWQLMITETRKSIILSITNLHTIPHGILKYLISIIANWQILKTKLLLRHFTFIFRWNLSTLISKFWSNWSFIISYGRKYLSLLIFWLS